MNSMAVGSGGKACWRHRLSLSSTSPINVTNIINMHATMPAGPGPIRRAWYQWKMRRFAWRKKCLVGFDLDGNTFWEFKDALHSLRHRRIAKYSRSTHYGDVNVSPAWMQWLRHTRFDPPSLAEQRYDMMRQERMKLLAARADANWASKPSALDAPDKAQPAAMLQSRDPKGEMTWDTSSPATGVVDSSSMSKEETGVHGGGVVESSLGGGGGKVLSGARDEGQTVRVPLNGERDEDDDGVPTIRTRKVMKKEPKDSPWKQAAAAGSNPSADWQPQEWSPGALKRTSWYVRVRG